MRDETMQSGMSLPKALPPGETIRWQGTPRWRALAVRAFHVRKVALYFGALMVWDAAAAVADGGAPTAALMAALRLAPVALAALALLMLLAWLVARSTLYTITDRRVVIGCGVALPMSLNIPFRTIASAGLKTYRHGDGDIPLSLTGPDKVPYLMLWPHVRPWRLRRVEPMLRGVPDAARVGEILACALAEAAPAPAMAESREERVPAGFAAPQAAAA